MHLFPCTHHNMCSQIRHTVLKATKCIGNYSRTWIIGPLLHLRQMVLIGKLNSEYWVEIKSKTTKVVCEYVVIYSVVKHSISSPQVRKHNSASTVSNSTLLDLRRLSSTEQTDLRHNLKHTAKPIYLYIHTYLKVTTDLPPMMPWKFICCTLLESTRPPMITLYTLSNNVAWPER